MDAPAPASAPAPSSKQVFDNPVDDNECYPNIDDFMVALQDPGKLVSSATGAKQKQSGGNCNTVIAYPMLMKVLAPVQKILQAKYSHHGVPKHPTECRRQLALACIRTRKSRDKGAVPEKFRQYGAEGAHSLFIINNNEDNGGFNIPLSSCLDYWRSQKKKDVDSRSANDGCRAASILLLPEFRDSVAKIMTEKRDRAMLDQACCPVSAFYEVAAEKFRDPLHVAKFPEKFTLIDGHESIDPNDEDRIMRDGRDGAWFKATWEQYLRPKYRKALGRWWSETGGGGGEIENFQNYCAREKWLTYVYMLDVEASHLLASNASSAVPKELMNESGHHQPTGTTTKTKSSTATPKFDAAALIRSTDNCTSNINKVAALMTALIEKRERAVPQASASSSNAMIMSTPNTMTSTPPAMMTKKRSLVDCLDEVKRLREHEKQIRDDLGVSPGTKEIIINRIQKEKKKVMVNAAAVDDNDSGDDSD